MLVRQAFTGLASLEELGAGVPPTAGPCAVAALARLSAADLEALAASLAILLDGARGLDAGAEDGSAG